jgi:hypothetical protein
MVFVIPKGGWLVTGRPFLCLNMGMKYFELFENLEDWNNGVWVHYTDEDFLSMRYNNKVPYETVKQPADKKFKKREVSRQFHQDPAGIYLFPEKFTPWPNWAKKKNVFYVTLKPSIRILDCGKLDEKEIRDFVALHGEIAVESFNDYTEQYPPENPKRMMKMAWEMIRRTMMGDYGKWNAILRRAGYDALFDDTGSVMSNEVQLILLNPQAIASVKKQEIKPNAYDNIFKIFDEVKEMCAPFGTIEVEPPQKRKEWGSYDTTKELTANVKVENADGRYAKFKINFDKENRTVNIHLQYSNPRLDYGSGATYSTITGKYESYSGLDRLEKDLKKIFSLKPEE